MNLDRNKVIHAARVGIPLIVKTHTLPAQTEADLEEILGIYLTEMGNSGLLDKLSYCLRELTGNAKKANTKRVYFQHKGLDLHNPADYEAGMRSFKADTLENIGTYLSLQEKAGLSIKVSFLIRHQTLLITVRNNAAILPAERERAQSRADRSWGFDSMDDAFADLLDDSEGAGLGIGILVLMLRKMGLDHRSFRLESLPEETVAVLTVPMDHVRRTQVNQVADKVAAVVDSLPPFPENLRHLLKLLEDPEVDFAALAVQLGRDPAMTADVLKYINSARNRGFTKIESLQEAIRIVGTQGLKDLMYPYGAHKLLAKYLDKQRDLWENATRVSLYAAELAREFRFSWGDQSRAQIAGLLYNLGQIILTFLHPELSAKVLRFCRTKGFSIELFDSLTASINPSDLGARIAEKWKFPEELVETLRFQTQPRDAQEGHRPVATVVHLAASLRYVELNLLQYDQMSETVLTDLKWADGAVRDLHDKIRRTLRV